MTNPSAKGFPLKRDYLPVLGLRLKGRNTFGGESKNPKRPKSVSFECLPDTKIVPTHGGHIPCIAVTEGGGHSDRGNGRGGAARKAGGEPLGRQRVPGVGHRPRPLRRVAR